MPERSVIEPRFAYRMMIWTYGMVDLFSKPGKQLDGFDIRPGHTVVDYGCGPGRYLKKASELVGGAGKVYAADIHPMALEYSNKRMRRFGLENVETVLVSNNSSTIPEHCADRIYALDMFHHVNEPGPFLEELHRIAKPSCKLFIEDGHQSRDKTEKKLSSCGSWKIAAKKEKWVQLEPFHDRS
jgi:ubiquinone/menaquinone biosynthesis C-methylase UbiE